MINNYHCRVCESADSAYFGKLPSQTHFAGKLLIKRLPESGLYKCNSCLILVRHPILTAVEYNRLYAQAESTVWSKNTISLRPDQIKIRDIILDRFRSARKVLDVGCYTGDLLSSLPEDYLKYGIEMSGEASAVSSERGIEIVGNDLYCLNTNEKYDLIIAADVIEHTQNPEEFLKSLSAMLSTEGGLIVSTGNTDCWMWRNLKNRFWYSRFAEHISFLGEAWLERFCINNNLVLSEKFLFNYSPISARLVIKNAVKTLLSLMRIYPERFSNTTKDHFCFIIKAKV